MKVSTFDREFQRVWLRKNTRRMKDSPTRVRIYKDNIFLEEIPPADFMQLLNKAWIRRPKGADKGFLIGITKRYVNTAAANGSVCNITHSQLAYLVSLAG